MSTVLISGFARSFISGEPIADATITVVENETLTFKTDVNGRFGPFEWPAGEAITLRFEKPGSLWSGYKTTQTATLIPPSEGINNQNYLKNISFQVPSNLAYKFLSFAMGVTEDPQACQIAATITPPNTTMDDIPQGVEGVKATLSPDVNIRPFYFGIFPVIHKTNPFIRTLEATSLDGGVAFLNVPPGDYTIEVTKDDIPFSKVTIKARQGVVVNASPPNGPTMLQEPQAQKAEKSQTTLIFQACAGNRSGCPRGLYSWSGFCCSQKIMSEKCSF
ncbi:carboxypeptidase-like regulatory domain-containing protein [Legionella tunisiensis]|uniref:carboxypeptidase-like regulatory domain-containing protein n=1 Tax=Legionella tunisiensis TaxID=1034944 RepID=UPI0002EEB923|nr:carboxypeptidase-like regulatory domain-containing protein [Legionella tunisiensis]